MKLEVIKNAIKNIIKGRFELKINGNFEDELMNLAEGDVKHGYILRIISYHNTLTLITQKYSIV